MKIEWKIEKKRGNLRPILTYSFIIEKHEKALALPPIRVQSTIQEPLELWQEYCYPNTLERAANPQYNGFYTLDLVSHKGHSYVQKIKLPFKEDNLYPEVDESFALLRETFENELAKASASQPMNEVHFLEISEKANQDVAPSVLAEKFLNFAKKNVSTIHA